MGYRKLSEQLGVGIATIARDAKDGMPTDSPEAAQAWRRANRRARIDSATTRRPAGGKPDKPSGAVHTKLPTYDPEGGPQELERLQAIVIRCMEAAEQSASTAELAAANRALKEARDTVRIAKRDMAETEIEAGNLIRRDDVLAVFNEFLGKARALVESMPQELAAQCNPSDPQLSANVMTDWSNNKYMVTMSQPPDVLAVDQV
jgi:hypothetical protein